MAMIVTISIAPKFFAISRFMFTVNLIDTILIQRIVCLRSWSSNHATIEINQLLNHDTESTQTPYRLFFLKQH